MAKRQSKYSQQFNKEWRRVTAAIRRTKKQGYQVGFNLGPKPTKITKRMLTRLQKITPRVIREQSFYISSTGQKESAQVVWNKKRLEAAKRGGQTRKRNRQSFEEFFNIENVPRRLSPAREAKLPKNIQWSEDFQSYGDFATGELISDIDSYISSIPDQQPIVMKNYLEEVGEQILPSDFFNELLELLEGNIEDTNSWYSRKAKSRIKSTHLMNRLAEKIHSMIRDKKSNKTYYRNIIEAGQKDQLMTAIEKVIYGYDESEISLGYSTALRILSGKDYALSAAEYSEADEEFE